MFNSYKVIKANVAGGGEKRRTRRKRSGKQGIASGD